VLSKAEGAELLRIARQAIETRLLKGSELTPETKAGMPPQGAFVTLYSWPEKRLRGCIGRVEGEWPLAVTVARMAMAAAFSDPRFPPLSASELPEIIIKISAMSPLSRVKGAEDVIIGKHGVLVRAKGRAGVFLPEVPVEWGWNVVQMLDRLCAEKMFMPADTWRKPGSEISVFTTETFGESEPGKI